MSAIDCLDLLSQTAPGQKYLRRIEITMGCYIMLRTFDGVLLRVLERLRGLQSVHIEIRGDWEQLMPRKRRTLEWSAHIIGHLLVLLKNEVAHVKAITNSTGFFE